MSYHEGCPGEAEHGPQSTRCEEQTLSWVPPGQPGAYRTCPGVEGKGGGTKQRGNKRHCGPERSTQGTDNLCGFSMSVCSVMLCV